MKILKKICIFACLFAVTALLVWLLVVSVRDSGFWTLFYLPEAGLLFLYGYIYFPVLVSILARPYLQKLVGAASVAPQPQGHYHHFVILIPAHNEAKVLPALLKSIQTLRYPVEGYQVWLVADNCQDSTLEIARQYQVNYLERYTDQPSNKGQALTFGWQNLQANPAVKSDSIILLIDADCTLDPNYLMALNQAFSQPDSPQVLQSFRTISNYRASSVSTLDAAAEALRQWVELGSREVLGLEGRICGTGVAFNYNVFAYLMNGQQHNLVEDKAWQASMFERQYRVGWCPAAHLNTSSTITGTDFHKQRRRWVSGQLALIKLYALPMLLQGLRRANLSQLDYALSLLQLPRSFLLGLSGLVGLVALIFPAAAFIPWWAWWLLSGLFFVYAAYGLFLIKAPAALYLRLFAAPLLVGRVFWITFRGLLGSKVKKWEAMREEPEEDKTEVAALNSSSTSLK